jgi:hypothetical protein
MIPSIAAGVSWTACRSASIAIRASAYPSSPGSSVLNVPPRGREFNQFRRGSPCGFELSELPGCVELDVFFFNGIETG